MTDSDLFPDLGATRFVRPRSLGDIVSATMRFIADNARALALGQLTIAGPALVLFVAVQALTGTGEVFVPDDPLAVDGDALLARFGSTLLVPYLALMVFTVVCYGVAYGYIVAYRRGETEEPLWEHVRPVLWPIVSVTLLALFLWTVIGGILSLTVIATLGAALGSAIGGTLGVIAILALVAYLVPAWTVGYPARLFDTDRSGDALGRGWSLVRGRWWMAFGTIVVITLIGIVLSIVVALPAGILEATREATGAGGASPLTRALLSVFNLLGSVLFTTLLAVASAFLHGSLSADADDVEMLDDLSRLEDPSAGAPPPATAGTDARDDRSAPPAAPIPPPAADGAPDGTPADDDAPDRTPADGAGGFRGGGFRGGGFGS